MAAPKPSPERGSGVDHARTLGFSPGDHYNGARNLARRDVARRLLTLSSTPPKPALDDFNQEHFNQLLDWLDADREKAGYKYESIRKRLIKIFVCRGSHIPEELADNTINRVARKLPEIRSGYVGDPACYFSGVASNIFRESLRKGKFPVIEPPRPAPPDEETEKDYVLLETCMEKLSGFDRDLVVAYYQQDKHEKIDNRKKMAERLGMNMNALRIRACRIRAALQECVEQCRSSQKSTKENPAGSHT